MISVDFVDETSDSVVNYKGQFYGCAIDKSNFNKDNNNLLDLIDKHSKGQLITNNNYCFNDPDKNYYCSYIEKWLPTDGIDRTHFSLAPILNATQAGECCANTECWDGQQCIENQKNDPLAQPIGNNSRCIDGEWTESQVKIDIEDNVQGYCPSETQCLASVLGKDEKQCVEQGAYIDDNYCENGEWASRTKLLALKLLKLKDNDFVLFCDNRENTLNNLQYMTQSNDVVENILTNMQTNNFCILKANSKVVAATSINKKLEDVPSNTLNIFGVADCNNALKFNDNQYHSCDETNRVWHNKKFNSFIYSSNAISIPLEQEQESYIKNIIDGVVDYLKASLIAPVDNSYLKIIKKFNTLYLMEEGGKSIVGSIEGKTLKSLVIKYANFDTDVCKWIDQFSQVKKSEISSGISCKNETKNYYVLAQGSQFTTINPEAIWPDLTSKLRLT